MRNLFLILALCVCSVSGYAQKIYKQEQKDSLTIVDVYADTVNISLNEDIVMLNIKESFLRKNDNLFQLETSFFYKKKIEIRGVYFHKVKVKSTKENYCGEKHTYSCTKIKTQLLHRTRQKNTTKIPLKSERVFICYVKNKKTYTVKIPLIAFIEKAFLNENNNPHPGEYE